jgi:succinoglycan biosynthesis protein ExoO
MRAPITIIMPAFRAASTLAKSVASLIAQTDPAWLLVLISDDGADYADLLARAGIVDQRIHFATTGGSGTGEGNARNTGLDLAQTARLAVLDADDRFAPQRVAGLHAALDRAPLAATAIRLCDGQGKPFGTVGEGPDALMPISAYKWRSVSTDSILAWDRTHHDPRYATDLRFLADLDFLMRLGATRDRIAYLGQPLFDYVKHPASLSNAPGAIAGMIAAKQRLAAQLAAGDYVFADPRARDSFSDFLAASLVAEGAYAAALAADPALNFEAHLDRYLAEGRARYWPDSAASTASA